MNSFIISSGFVSLAMLCLFFIVRRKRDQYHEKWDSGATSKERNQAHDNYYKFKGMANGMFVGICMLLTFFGTLLFLKIVGDADYRAQVNACKSYGKQTGYETKMHRQDTFAHTCYVNVNGQWTDRDDIITRTNK